MLLALYDKIAERRESDRSAAPRGGWVNAIRRSMGIVVGLMFLWMAGTLRSGDTKSLDARRQELRKLVAEEWEYVMREYPEFATIVGDYRYNDRWSDGSLAHVEQTKKDEQEWLARFEAIDTTGFPEQERLDRQLMVRNLKAQIQSIELKLYEMPVDQFYGAHLQLAQFVASIPFHTTRQYEDYLTRLHQIPRLMTELVEILKQGTKDKLLPPKFLLEKTVEQCESIAGPAGESNVFGQPVIHFPDGVPETDASGRMTRSWPRGIWKCHPPTPGWRASSRRSTRRKAEPTPECGRFQTERRSTAFESVSRRPPIWIRKRSISWDCQRWRGSKPMNWSSQKSLALMI